MSTKKLAYEFVKNEFEKAGCSLLETEYINCKTKMKYKCKNEHQSEIDYAHFSRGRRCKKCSDEEKKLTFEYVKEFFKKEGYELLEDNYVDSTVKMKYKCNHNHISEITFNSFNSGCRCAKCNGTEKLTYEFVKEAFEKEGCVLLEKEYINSCTKMKYRCSCGNISNNKISWDSFKSGNRCKKCGNKKIGDKLRLTYEFVKEQFEKAGCELLEKEYIGVDVKMRFKCVCGNNKSKISYHSLSQGCKCKKCGTKRMADQYRHNFEFIKKEFEKEGCALLETEYVNNRTKMKYICNCGNQSLISYDSFNHGGRCVKCNQSKGERSIRKILLENSVDFEEQKPFEGCKHKRHLHFDFYVPNKNICVEFDGTQHFKPTKFGNLSDKKFLESFEEQQKRDKIKDEFCKNNNIKLLRIPYTEFNSLEEILKREVIYG